MKFDKVEIQKTSKEEPTTEELVEVIMVKAGFNTFRIKPHPTDPNIIKIYKVNDKGDDEISINPRSVNLIHLK